MSGPGNTQFCVQYTKDFGSARRKTVTFSSCKKPNEALARQIGSLQEFAMFSQISKQNILSCAPVLDTLRSP